MRKNYSAWPCFSLLLALSLFVLPAFAQVQEVWARNYTTSSLEAGEHVKDMVTEASGNVIVLGTNVNGTVLLKYDVAGTLLWNKPINFDAIKVITDVAGNIYLIGRISSQFYTAKYNPGGTLLWASPYFILDGETFPRDIAVDEIGNVYVVGRISRGNSDEHELEDCVTVKYNSGGDLLWARPYNGANPSLGYDAGSAVTLDAFGNIYVAATSQRDGSRDIATLKYNPAGTLLWENRYIGPNGEEDEAADIALDVFGNVLVTGTSVKIENSTLVYERAVAVKYLFSGFQLWAQTIGGTSGLRYDAMQIMSDASGNVLAYGHTYSFPYLVKFNPAGTLLWSHTYPLFGLTSDAATDGTNAYFIASSGSGTGSSTLKIGPGGNTLWTMNYEAASGTFRIGTDNLNDVFISSALTNPASGGSDIITIRYSQCSISVPSQVHIPAEPGVCGATVNFQATTTGNCDNIEYQFGDGTPFYTPGQFLNAGHYHLAAVSPSTGERQLFTIYVDD
ncbi:MAG TPA: hypothetical protein VK498_00375, partial [Ferruginibacter sp.]|nr:hypothetical protein [Ferruginibacter sp.]